MALSGLSGLTGLSGLGIGTAAPAGPTTLLDLNWLTDTLLNEGLSPISNGNDVESWAFATGGTATGTLAIAAGAVDRCLYSTANGVQTNGLAAALTLPSPVTIPADTDCVIYLKGILGGSDLYLGSTTTLCSIVFGLSAGAFFSGTAGAAAGLYGEPTPGTYLFRARRVSNAWRFAWTGQADTAEDGGGSLAGGAITIDTLLSYGNGSGLTNYSTTGDYIQKAYIFHGSSTPDTAYETANGGVL